MRLLIRHCVIALFFTCSAFYLFAAEGDTTIITSHNKQHMKFPPGDRTYTNRVEFPDGSVSYRKILLNYTLGCPPGGCSAWDYTTKVEALRPTGTYDSNMVQRPYFTVDGSALDSVHFSRDTTYITFFDATNMVTDSTPSDSLFFRRFLNAGNPTVATDSFYGYLAGYYNYYYNALGVIIDSAYVPADSSWYQQYHIDYDVFEVIEKIELGRLITPYFGNYYPYTVTFDVTDYATLLRDSVDISLIFDGWQDGFLGTLDFVFIEGTPPRDPKRIMTLYHGVFQYGRVSNPIENHLVPKDLDFLSSEKQAILHFTPSGHSFGGNENCAEFCPKNYYVYVNGTQRYKQLAWRDDCGDNPIFPQGGTWIYDRSNWCPGLEAIRRTHELTPFINFGQSNNINVDFDPYTYNGSAQPGTTPDPNYIIDAVVVTFGDANFSLDASIEEIIAPNDNILHNRNNPICGDPIVRIRNTGSTTLTSLKIEYGPVGGNMAVYNWTGSLAFLESEVVTLPDPDWSSWGTGNVYQVKVMEPNGSADEYDQNDVLTSTFGFPELMPDSFVVWYKANTATQNKLYIRDDAGNIVYQNTSPANNVQYQDTVRLQDGCYEFEITDAGGDGLRFFGANAGQLLFRYADQPRTAKNFELEFGNSLKFQFTVGFKLTGVDAPFQPADAALLIYPNPSEGLFTLELTNFNDREALLDVFDMAGNRIRHFDFNVIDGSAMKQLDLRGYATGVYTVIVHSNQYHSVKRIVVQ